MNCDIKSCIPYLVFSFLIVIGINIFIWLVIYLFIVYDTYMYHSNDLISWKNEQIDNINDETYNSYKKLHHEK